MGWSLSGILGAAMVGGAGAAERNFVETRRDEQAIAKAKELAEFNSTLQFDREQRVAEGRTARALKLEQQARDSDATNMELAKEYATRSKDDKDDPGAGAKPGSVEFYDAQADFLNRSGRKDLAKDMLTEANRIRVDDTKDQIATARAETARARREGGGGSRGGSASSEAGKIDIDAALGNIAKIGVSTKDGEAKLDPGAYAVSNSFYNQAFANTKDEKRALDAARTMMIRAYEYAQDNNVSLRDAAKAVVGKVKDAQKANAEKVRVGRDKEISQFPEEAPMTGDGVEANINYLRNQGKGQSTQAAGEKDSNLGWWE